MWLKNLLGRSAAASRAEGVVVWALNCNIAPGDWPKFEGKQRKKYTPSFQGKWEPQLQRQFIWRKAKTNGSRKRNKWIMAYFRIFFSRHRSDYSSKNSVKITEDIFAMQVKKNFWENWNLIFVKMLPLEKFLK